MLEVSTRRRLIWWDVHFRGQSICVCVCDSAQFPHFIPRRGPAEASAREARKTRGRAKMNRQTLAEATSLHDGPVPIYLMEEIARTCAMRISVSVKGGAMEGENAASSMEKQATERGRGGMPMLTCCNYVRVYVCMYPGSTKESARDAEKVADFMLGRLNKSNLIVKLKALQLIAVRTPPSSCFVCFISYDEPSKRQWSLTADGWCRCTPQYCVREGSPAFAGAVREEEQEIAAYLRECCSPCAIHSKHGCGSHIWNGHAHGYQCYRVHGAA